MESKSIKHAEAVKRAAIRYKTQLTRYQRKQVSSFTLASAALDFQAAAVAAYRAARFAGHPATQDEVTK
jgi:hypothetical protein